MRTELEDLDREIKILLTEEAGKINEFIINKSYLYDFIKKEANLKEKSIE